MRTIARKPRETINRIPNVYHNTGLFVVCNLTRYARSVLSVANPRPSIPNNTRTPETREAGETWLLETYVQQEVKRALTMSPWLLLLSRRYVQMPSEIIYNSQRAKHNATEHCAHNIVMWKNSHDEIPFQILFHDFTQSIAKRKVKALFFLKNRILLNIFLTGKYIHYVILFSS